MNEWQCAEGQGELECKIDKCLAIVQLRGLTANQSISICGEWYDKTTYRYISNNDVVIERK